MVRKTKVGALLGRPPLTSREDRSPEMRQRLIEATVEAILEVGYARTSISEIVKRAGVTNGAFVYLYKNKFELIKTTVKYLFSKVRERTEKYFSDPISTVEEVEEFLQRLADVTLDNTGIAIFEIWMASRTDPELRKTFALIETENSAIRSRGIKKLFGIGAAKSKDVIMLTEGAILVLRGLSLQKVLADGLAENDLWLWWRRRLAEELITCLQQITEE